MIRLESITFFYLLFLPSSILRAQTLTSTTYYTAYQTSFQYVTSCPTAQYYDIALLQCSPCPTNATQKSTDETQCDCVNNTYYYTVNQGGGSIGCSLCPSGSTRSTDGFGCTTYDNSCVTTLLTNIGAESDLSGALNNSASSSAQPRIAIQTCTPCVAGTWGDSSDQRCIPCASLTPNTGQLPSSTTCCTSNSTGLKDGVCLTNVIGVLGALPISTLSYSSVYNSNPTSLFFSQHLDASVYLCQMNLNSSIAQASSRTLLSNVTACHVLANIAAMQFYNPTTSYAYDLYNRYIWTPATSAWTASSTLPAIPFLAYPSTYYQEITNSSYNWIPASTGQNDLIRLKLAKYSSTGQFLGLIDAFDAVIQLCGGAYTDGQSAFTFGTQYQRTCQIRADALWNSTLYDTAFFDPYLVFTQSGVDQIIPTPVVIKNYVSITGATPNQNVDPSKWTYHRRFFLLDRISGVTPNNELRNIHYAKSIQILYTLTGGTTYIQPPVIVIEYDALSTSDIGKGTTVEITFQTQYGMNLDSHIAAIWIAIGVLAGVGILFAMLETAIWQGRAGKEIIDLGTIGKFLLYVISNIGTIFFIVMAGVSLWWLIFFKRQDAVYLVIPTTIQQASFTSLVVIAFVLKTLDILHLIIRQSNVDIFFIDWEKPKTGDINTVSVWRSYFVANEYSEIQTFRRINVTVQLIFVLFLLKVINLENIAAAQPNSNLFPSSANYQAGYNGILRVGIAFSMWLATGLIQYLIYTLFYQRFVEDKIINFIDLCSLCNISVFILMDRQYGFYVHGQSANGIADVNMKEMLDYLQREIHGKVGGRGLVPNTDDQMFILRMDRNFRLQYETLLRNYRNRILMQATKKGDEHESEILLASYQNLNDFLCKFIEHALPTYNYSIRTRVLLEKILNWEFRFGNLRGVAEYIESAFLIDNDRNFTKTFFSGNENSLFIWNMATFLFIDYFASNYVLAAIITYLLNQAACMLRTSLGQTNLSKKTLIPKNFLI